jgi:hypothetical protein
MNREVCSADKTSVEPKNINSIQTMAGIHLLTKQPMFMFKSRASFHRIVANTKPV